MQFSFEFEDYFRNGRGPVVNRSDVKTPTFLVQSGVVGDLKIKDLKAALLSDEHTRLEVNLEGFMRTELDTCVDKRSEFRVTVEKKILSMTQALSIREHANNVSRNERHYPFNFDVKSWLRHDQESDVRHRVMATRNNFSSLPPSLKHEVLNTPHGVPRPRAGAQVTYKLTAKLFKGRRVLHGIAQPILLLMSQDPSPPTCITDFKGEYRPAQTTVLRGPLFQKAGELSVFVQEPKPLRVKAHCAESMVEVPVKLRLERNGQEISISEQLCVEAEVKWQFRFATFVSILEQRGPVTMKQAQVSPATAHVMSTLKPRTLTMKWRKWESSRDLDGSKAVESEQSLWLTLPRSEIMTPTFWSPFLSRRYSIWLQLKVIRPGNAKLEVEVPIQVGIEATVPEAYDQPPRSNSYPGGESIFDDADGDELLPQYSR